MCLNINFRDVLWLACLKYSFVSMNEPFPEHLGFPNSNVAFFARGRSDADPPTS